MRKSVLVIPLYISVAWILMISYQLFTQTAVTTVIAHINVFWPSVSAWLVSRMDMVVFIYAFAWFFVFSSVIPSVILGKERRVLIQFFVCLTLTSIVFVFQDILTIYGEKPIEQIFGLAAFLHDPFIAAGYLLMPYLLMLMLDICAVVNAGKKRELELERSIEHEFSYLERKRERKN